MRLVGEKRCRKQERQLNGNGSGQYMLERQRHDDYETVFAAESRH
ncbi:hypothetical protein [Paenibacillus polysaccharolyticus]|nr:MULTISPECIES: hypothetical protein [Paenibacillus]